MSDVAHAVSVALRARGLKMTAAESCTGGMIAAAITDLAGSSDVFDRGFVTYSNQSKTDMLDVSASTLERYGAVSEQTAHEMCQGALKNSLANVAVAVTGIAGPSGGSADKPVGLVYIGVCTRDGEPRVARHIFSGSRAEVRMQARDAALHLILNLYS